MGRRLAYACLTRARVQQMVDILSPQARSERMRKVHSRGNQTTELALRKALQRNKVSGWRRHAAIRLAARMSSRTDGAAASIVRPDFVFSHARVVVFVDGCFWHSCPKHRTAPKNNAQFWQEKLTANRRRDQRVNKCLRRAGWTVVRIWEHDVKASPDICARRILRLIRNA
jgi:DNA mismatch endonuclease (patch repair protein)